MTKLRDVYFTASNQFTISKHIFLDIHYGINERIKVETIATRMLMIIMAIIWPYSHYKCTPGER